MAMADNVPQLELEFVNKTYASEQGPVQALQDIHLKVRRGELITVIGPSGCGKSTLLRIIAGLDRDYAGSVRLNGEPVRGPGKDKGFVFQEPRLFPWLTVERNIAADLPLRDPNVRSRIRELLRTVRLEGFDQAFPKQLSGGMAQRAAIARALLRSPEVLLLDEPFGALDTFTRAHLQEVLLDLWRLGGTTMILVTHDIDEAVYLGERIVIMDARPGTIRRIVPIDLPYPRKKAGSSFLEFRKLVMNEFERVEELQLTESSGI